jgi:hypothetical protein
VHELPWNSSAVNVTFDRYDFIWHNFSKQGYRTLYSEDAPFGQIFDYQKAGFVKPQADYFDRIHSPSFLACIESYYYGILNLLQPSLYLNEHCFVVSGSCLRTSFQHLFFYERKRLIIIFEHCSYDNWEICARITMELKCC